MTKQTPAEILREFLDAVDFTLEIDAVEVSAHFFDRPFTDALAALDDYYRQYYMGLLPSPEVDLIAFSNDKTGWIEEVNVDPDTLEDKDIIAIYRLARHFKQLAIDDMRHRMEGNDE